ncbi:hypothetical protein RsTz2092_05630 [Deferribacterales bacterium RsTz2092]|nr:hypothetical protein AGMMS49941_10280 [Deferribacterales bacterium]
MAGKKQTIALLEELANKLNVRVRYEKTTARGGLCQHEGSFQIIIDKKASDDYKISLLATSLKTFDLSDIYVSDGLREVLNNT